LGEIKIEGNEGREKVRGREKERGRQKETGIFNDREIGRCKDREV
jgi:hypothetical protein